MRDLGWVAHFFFYKYSLRLTTLPCLGEIAQIPMDVKATYENLQSGSSCLLHKCPSRE